VKGSNGPRSEKDKPIGTFYGKSGVREVLILMADRKRARGDQK